MKQFDVRVNVLLEPVGTPDVVITCGKYTRTAILTEPTWVNFTYSQAAGPCQLTVEHRNRKDHVTAVIVKTVELNDITHLQNTYQGMYYPDDMEPRRDTYIAWNGVWILNFTVPVYTWMHQTQNLGWIYD